HALSLPEAEVGAARFRSHHEPQRYPRHGRLSAAAIADAILVVHAAFVLFVVGGLIAIWAVIALGWRFAFNPWFRGLHLAASAFVVAESVLGFVCPLTEWEDTLRGTPSDKGFIQRWIHAWLFWDWP